MVDEKKEFDGEVYRAVFAEGGEKERRLRALRERVLEMGVRPASIYPLYREMAREFPGFTVPAVNIRGLTYDVARTLFRVARRLSVGAVLVEIARSEMGYTRQRPLEYATVVLAAAAREEFPGPVFLQGDHFQANRRAFLANPQAEKEALRALIREAIEAGFYNIDIDASTLVDLSKETLEEQQRPNYELTAELAAYVRSLEPEGITVNLGGEIGEIGGHNSTPEELRAFMEGFGRSFSGEVGLSKISVQTGSSHGGVVLPDGSVARVQIDFDTLRVLSDIARREYGLAGAVQHGASTLPEDYFHLFPDVGCAEIHLATGFQNIVFDHPALPAEFKERVYAYLRENLRKEWKEGWTEAQFLYKTRKKAFGIFKKEWWDLPEKVKIPIMETLAETFERIFRALRVIDTLELVRRVIRF
ncbi:class II fructose-bisphosphate aldolase [Thermosulfurimonas sp. F29]|uniref:class II fructose-bisphosphate aldolase n=1 Tax=Thermosulfurimonas sp. F29 TaxID=2867247 RepID=UPI001C83533A|nr:class II fructose-bisphosphate aldolase [Thermosulfurimonas sp. F29]MBX6423991.1 class II fructose-bisphosphate aldolase [Thermosulfurimonas sp. F29]